MSRWVCALFEFILVTIQFLLVKITSKRSNVQLYGLLVRFSAWRQHDITCLMIEKCLIQLVTPPPPPLSLSLSPYDKNRRGTGDFW